MAIEGLAIIGESINDSVPSTNKLYEANDIEGLKELARMQDAGGAAFIDVNVGLRTPEFMAFMVQEVQSVTTKPLSIDTPDFALAEAGLKAYDPAKAGGKRPILNSITLNRVNMFDLYAVQPFLPLLLSCEREENGESRPNRTGEENYQSAKKLLEIALSHGLTTDQVIIDPGIAPIGSDMDGLVKMAVDALKLMHADPAFKGAHRSVGLSNFTVMLPTKKADGSPIKGPLESAFLTYAMPLGLDTIIGNVKRNYQQLPAGDPALVCLEEVLERSGMDCIMRVMEFYS